MGRSGQILSEERKEKLVQSRKRAHQDKERHILNLGKWSIHSDSRQFILRTAETEKYFTSIESLCGFLVRQQIPKSHKRTLESFLAAFRRNVEDLLVELQRSLPPLRTCNGESKAA